MNRNKITMILIIAIGLIGGTVLVVGFPQIFSLIYWWLLVFIISLIWNFKLRSGYILWIALFLFLVSALFVAISLREIAEITMRISFLGWIIGLIQSFVEYKKLE